MSHGFRWLVGAFTAALLAGPSWGDEKIDLGPALADQTLDQHRAKQQVNLNLMDVRAGVDGNQAINTLSGSNFISDNAFGSASGVVNTIQNSGNNNSIQMPLNLIVNVR